MDPPERHDGGMEMQPLTATGPRDPDAASYSPRPSRNGRSTLSSTRAKKAPTMEAAVAHGESVIAMIGNDPKKKKMLLVFLSILLVAMVGMVAVKGHAVELEKIVEEGDVEIAVHEDKDNDNNADEGGEIMMPFLFEKLVIHCFLTCVFRIYTPTTHCFKRFSTNETPPK